jgi:hypothetical protein
VRDRDWGWGGVFRVGFREGIRIFFVYEKEEGRGEKRKESEMMNYDVMMGWN